MAIRSHETECGLVGVCMYHCPCTDYSQLQIRSIRSKSVKNILSIGRAKLINQNQK